MFYAARERNLHQKASTSPILRATLNRNGAIRPKRGQPLDALANGCSSGSPGLAGQSALLLSECADHATLPYSNAMADTYGQAGETRCFLEELPQDTIVVGHYKAEEWAVDDSKWIINDRLGIQITVEVSSPMKGE